jgi:dTDP-4-dehydrorhamnose reductase
MRILVTGDTGLLGPYLKMAFSRLGTVEGLARSSCDLTDWDSVRTWMAKTAPQMIVHAAALTDIDECEKDPNKAVLYNCGMVENIAAHMPGNCRLIYISTDMVYSGNGPHREHSKSENPINMYGMSKFMGEFAAAKVQNHLIVRTNFYGSARSPARSSLADFMIGKLKSGVEFNVYTDAMFSPLWAQTLAERLVAMANTPRTGTFNLGSSSGMSKAKFAALLANGLGHSLKGLRPVESVGIPGRIPRPLDTRLDLTRVESKFGFTLPNMEQDIARMCQSIRCTN